MQKRPDRNRAPIGVPLLVCLFHGLLFFGVYIALERLSLKGMPTLRVSITFLAAYVAIAALTYVLWRLRAGKQNSEQVMMEALNTKMHNLFKYTVDLPYLICDAQGRVRVVNTALQKLLGTHDPFYRGNVAGLCGVTLEAIVAAGGTKEERTDVGRFTQEAIGLTDAEEAAPGRAVTVTLHGGRFAARAYPVTLNGTENYLVTFTDVTDFLALKEKSERDMPVVAYLDVDNLEELTQYTRASYRDSSRRVDDILLHWTAEHSGLLREYERDRYLILFSQEELARCEAEQFASLLERIRGIRLGEYSIPVTVSVGISAKDATMEERAREALSVLDMALQRGGDQVAVRRPDGIHYYGGQTRPFQRRTKVQSRVVANYLLSKISSAENLLIMGHRNPDFDSVGSCVGLAQLGLFAGVPTKVIVDLDNENFRTATERLAASRNFSDLFISGHRGLDLVRPGTLLLISDVNNFDIIEAPDVAASVRQISGKIAIIDHHRQTSEYGFEPVMNYVDPSASSASELVAEILEQVELAGEVQESKLVGDEVASVLFSGIMLDTGGFTRNTGSRTLDAARYLMGQGANAEYVHSFFNEDYEEYVRARSFSGCELMHGNTVGLTWSEGTGKPTDDRVAAAKEADRLLAVKGVSAAFALVAVENAVHISGRSDGSVNVQLILEKLGGGGRFDSAGAALSDTPLPKALQALRGAIQAYFDVDEKQY